MKKSYVLLLISFLAFNFIFSQELFLKKGTIIESIALRDSVKESFSLYLPTKFENKGQWPVLFVFDTKGNVKETLAKFSEAAESENYILAASNNISDTLSVTNNVLIAGRMISDVISILPIHKNQIYTGGFGSGGKLANLLPIFIKNIEGAVSSGAPLANMELLATNNPFHFIGIIGKEDFNYLRLLSDEKILNRFKFPNNLIVFDGGNKWPDKVHLRKALKLFTLSAMAKGHIKKDTAYIDAAYSEDLDYVNKLKNDKKMLIADRALSEMLTVYRPHKDISALKNVWKEHRKDKLYRSLKRNENAAFFKEALLKEDYAYYLEEDLYAYNYNNLGWWNYQMSELNKFIYGDSKSQQQMGKRLYAYVNALIEDYIDTTTSEKEIDDEAFILLSMLKTITEPMNYDYYLNVISLSSKYEDYGTALFYLEEALKKNFKNRERLDKLEHAALLRISPEYNKLIEEYFNDARYKTTVE